MTTRTSFAEWKGNLKEGAGTMKLASGTYEGPFTFASRFEDGKGTNPEELIGAAQAGCFSMYFSLLLTKAGYTVENISTSATVHLGEGPTITRIEVKTEAKIPGIPESEFLALAEDAKKNCPISKALAGPEITLSATLL
ncbi:MAG: OsmC family protein [Anaerolineales bacterium]|jgi:osmotically inducible protein OsmC|nr:OsmC family protein [Anaerolineales bacterium]